MKSMSPLVFLEPLKSFSCEAQPCCIAIIEIHHFLPHPDRQAITRLPVPGDLRDLQSHATGVEHRPAEQGGCRYLAILEAVAVLCDRDVEIERAWHGHFYDGHSVKPGYVHIHVCPQQRVQGLTPALRL